MFGFSSGGSSIGGSFSANSFTNSPVSFGGNITQGDMTTGATTQTSNTSSTGGTTSQGLDLSIPPIPALMMLDTEGTYIGHVNCDVGINCRILPGYSADGQKSTSTTVGVLTANTGGGFTIGLI